jgi:hypothetical protein
VNNAVQQRIALVAAMIVLAAAVITVLVDDDEEEISLAVPSPSASPVQTTTASAAASAKPSAAATKAPVATAAPVATSAPADDLSVAVPPKPGTYTYREKRGGETSEAFLEIANRGPGKQSEEQDGARADVIWSKESKLIDKVTFGTPPQGFECDFAPNIAELKFPLKIGNAWNMKGKCTAPPGITVDFTGTGRVTGKAKRTVGGVSVDTWRILTKATIRFSTAQGSFNETLDSDAYLAPAHGVAVYSIDKTSGTDPTTGERLDETSTKELVSLTPS